MAVGVSREKDGVTSTGRCPPELGRVLLEPAVCERDRMV